VVLPDPVLGHVRPAPAGATVRFVDVFPTLQTDRYVGRTPERIPGGRRPRECAAGRVARCRADFGPVLRASDRALRRPSGPSSAAGATHGRAVHLRPDEPQRMPPFSASRARKAFHNDILGEACLSERQPTGTPARPAHYLLDLRCRPRLAARARDRRARRRPMPRDKSRLVTSLTPHFEPIAPQRAVAAALERLAPLVRLAPPRGRVHQQRHEQYSFKDPPSPRSRSCGLAGFFATLRTWASAAGLSHERPSRHEHPLDWARSGARRCPSAWSRGLLGFRGGAGHPSRLARALLTEKWRLR